MHEAKLPCRSVKRLIAVVQLKNVTL